jgi:hypothetical protein
MNATLTALKEDIKRFAFEGTEIHKQIKQAKGLERATLWNQKRSVGDDARYCLLAYGALKGTPYNRIEERCRNKPSSYHLARVVQNALPVEERAPWTLDAIKSWVGQEGGK